MKIFRVKIKISTPGSTVLISRGSARRGRCASKNWFYHLPKSAALGISSGCQKQVNHYSYHRRPYPEFCKFLCFAHLVSSFHPKVWMGEDPQSALYDWQICGLAHAKNKDSGRANAGRLLPTSDKIDIAPRAFGNKLKGN